MISRLSILKWIFFDWGATLAGESVFESYMFRRVYELLRDFKVRLHEETYIDTPHD